MQPVSGGVRIKIRGSLILRRNLGSNHGEEVVTLEILLWRRTRVTGWDSGPLSISKWSQNAPQCSSHGLWSIGCSPLCLPAPLYAYLLLNFRPQLKYHFPKAAFSDPTGQTRSTSTHSHKVPLFCNSSHILLLCARRAVLSQGQFCLPGDICLCLETLFVVTTGGGVCVQIPRIGQRCC